VVIVRVDGLLLKIMAYIVSNLNEQGVVTGCMRSSYRNFRTTTRCDPMKQNDRSDYNHNHIVPLGTTFSMETHDRPVCLLRHRLSYSHRPGIES